MRGKGLCRGAGGMRSAAYWVLNLKRVFGGGGGGVGESGFQQTNTPAATTPAAPTMLQQDSDKDSDTGAAPEPIVCAD